MYLLKMIRDWWVSLWCDHTWVHERNIYGDEINHLNARSIWSCNKCKKQQLRQSLQPDTERERMRFGVNTVEGKLNRGNNASTQ